MRRPSTQSIARRITIPERGAMDAPKLDALACQQDQAAATITPLSHQADIDAHLAVLPDWRYVADRCNFPARPHRQNFHFKNYYETIALCEHRGIDFACD